MLKFDESLFINKTIVSISQDGMDGDHQTFVITFSDDSKVSVGSMSYGESNLVIKSVND